ncbi:MAG: DUF2061 domain-containing protein [Gammaproteobacteria bacterium]
MTKTITFACLHFSVAFGVAYALTGSVLIGGAMALVEPLINTVVFHFHERAWRRWEAGRAAPAQAGAGRHLHLVSRAA